MEEIILEVKNLQKCYADFQLREIDFALLKGSITGFIGQNGAGKSTTIKCIMQLVKPDQGTVTFRGNRISGKDRISYLSSELELYPDERLASITGFIKKAFKGRWNSTKYLYYTNAIFKLDERRKFKELSSGSKVKYLIALELSKEPELILFDEPTSGLDPVVRNDILDILKELASNEKVTVFFSSHITEDIEKIADKVIYIDNGKIILCGQKSEINKRFVKIHLSEIGELEDRQRDIIIEHGTLKNESYRIDRNLITGNIGCKFSPIPLDEVLLMMKEAKNV
ncbi:ABC transporter ATP-binding protein [Lachnospiraceae bacterium ZAX-1]